VSVENRLTAEQLAALMPGDTVLIESGFEFGRRRYGSGTVVRVDASDILVKTDGRGGTFVERYSRRDGIRVGGLTRAELINPDDPEPVLTETRRRTRHIDTLYREWTRNRIGLDRLRRLHAAISECLEVQAEPVQ
jgi:hypothetical protein